MGRHLISSDAIPHVRQYVLTSHHDREKIGLQTEYEAAPTIEQAAYLRHRQDAAIKRDKDFKTLAVVPIVVYMQAMKEQWGQKEWRAWLNDPANALLRVNKD